MVSTLLDVGCQCYECTPSTICCNNLSFPTNIGFSLTASGTCDCISDYPTGDSIALVSGCSGEDIANIAGSICYDGKAIAKKFSAVQFFDFDATRYATYLLYLYWWDSAIPENTFPGLGGYPHVFWRFDLTNACANGESLDLISVGSVNWGGAGPPAICTLDISLDSGI